LPSKLRGCPGCAGGQFVCGAGACGRGAGRDGGGVGEAPPSNLRRKSNSPMSAFRGTGFQPVSSSSNSKHGLKK
jgi:hypothetical protein